MKNACYNSSSFREVPLRQNKFDFMNDFNKSFGGSLLRGKRKTARTLSTKKPIHLIFKTSGRKFFNPGNTSLERIIHEHASKYKIKIYRLSLNWSHFHMIIQLPSRSAYNAFVRTLAAAIVRKVSKYFGESLKGIFDLRPFTRILEWGRDFQNVMGYHDLNDLEARGYVKRPKKTDKNTNNKSEKKSDHATDAKPVRKSFKKTRNKSE